MILDKEFYSLETTQIAKKLLGCYLIHESGDGVSVGRIVETEAYLGTNDPASHGFKGVTNRTKVMFGEPGKAYIYFTYGMYFCFNVTTAPDGVGEAVLIRALEPIVGIELMRKRRGKLFVNADTPNIMLTNGPAKLVIAMGITKDMYGTDLTQPPLYITSSDHFDKPIAFDTAQTTRVGISKAVELPLRFFIKGNEFVSKH